MDRAHQQGSLLDITDYNSSRCHGWQHAVHGIQSNSPDYSSPRYGNCPGNWCWQYQPSHTKKIGSQGESVSELQATLALLGFYSGPVDGVYRDSTAKAVSQFKQVVGLAPDGIVDTITWQKLFPSVPNIATTTPPPSPISSTPRNNPENRQPTTRNGGEGNSNNNTIRKNTQPPTRPIMVFNPTPVNQRNPKIQYTQSGWPILRLGNAGAEVTKLQRLLRSLGFFSSPLDGKFSVTLEKAVKAAQLRYGLTADGVVGGQTWDVFFIQRLPRLP